MKKNNTTFADYLRNALRRLNTKPIYLTAVALLGLSTLGIAQTVPAYVPTDGLVGWWPFNGNAIDESINTNDGIVNGATLTSDRNGIANSAFSFDGLDDYISATPTLPTGSSPRTVSCWFKTIAGSIPTSQYPNIQAMTGWGNPFSGAVIFPQFVQAPAGKAYFESGSSGNQLFSQNAVNEGIWHQIVTTYDGSRVKMYIDTTLQDSSAVVSLGTTSSFFGIGNVSWANVPFQGQIDDVGLWDRALTQQEITALYNANNCNNLTATVTPAQPTCGLPNGTLTGSATGGNGTYAYLWSNGATTATVANLSAGTYTVTVTSAAGCTASSSSTVNNSICPKLTTQSTVNNITQNSATISWPAVPCAAKYRVVVKNVSTGVQTTTLVTAPNTSLNLSSLQPNTTYQVRIRTQCSQNGTVVSQLSPIRSFTTLNNQGIQCLPPTVSGITLSNTSVTINWTPSLGAIQYNLRYRKVGTTTWTNTIISNGLASSITIEGLSASNTYEFQLRTKCNNNPDEFSPYSAILNFTTTVAGTITSLTCAEAANSGTLTSGIAASGVSSVVPYTGGNGGTHNGQTVTSTGVTGLTATLPAGTFANGSGSLTYTISGTPASSGTASFALSIGGQNCALTRTVNANGQTGITAHTCGADSVHNPVKTYGTMTDQQGNVYKTIVIGTQEWMAENLKTTIYRNGDAIANVTNNSQWAGLTTGAWCYYNNNSQYDCPYGKLYNWYAVADPRNVCPTGWHVPTDAEWTTLTSFLGGTYSNGELVAGGKMKSTGLQYWFSPNEAATNESGFSGLPGGYRSYSSGGFSSVGNSGLWWSSTESAYNARARDLSYDNGTAYRGNYNKRYGFSVRCLRDQPASGRLEETSTIQGINIYPNPTNSTINVVINATSETQTTIRITDLLGRVLLNETEELLSGNNTITYNISEYAAGVYLVHVGNGKTQQVYKVVKE